MTVLFHLFTPRITGSYYSLLILASSRPNWFCWAKFHMQPPLKRNLWCLIINTNAVFRHFFSLQTAFQVKTQTTNHLFERRVKTTSIH
mmetsp:Transcript_29353/g.79465  ORF Transcript_29353/g.79465 Transcript_29353/m.79465 type:complete len:88 (+) Transcript_29353:944-1207(+)